MIKRVAGFALKRSMPALSPQTFLSWYKSHQTEKKNNSLGRRVYLFADEFTNYNDAVLMIDREWQEAIAKAHAKGILEYAIGQGVEW